MAKLSRLQRSQKAHRRLLKKAVKDVDLRPNAQKKWNYHSHVLGEQERKRRVLTRSERKYVWRWA